MELKGDDSLINIKVLGWSNPSAINEWDKKWIIVHIYLRIAGFTADYKAEFLCDDLLLFKESIEAALNNKSKEVELKTMEESVYLKGVVNYLGNIEWIGLANYPIGSANKLHFKFESEYCQLVRLEKDLNDISKLWMR